MKDIKTVEDKQEYIDELIWIIKQYPRHRNWTLKTLLIRAKEWWSDLTPTQQECIILLTLGNNS